MNERLPSLQVILEGSLDRVREVGRVLRAAGVESQSIAPQKLSNGG